MNFDKEVIIYRLQELWAELLQNGEQTWNSFTDSIGDIMFPENLTIASALILMIITSFSLISKSIKENSVERKKINEINHQMYLVDEEDRYYPLNADEIIIGRHSAVDVKFSELYVSRYHAIINVCNGTWSITDLNSSYGTFVNGQRISHKRIYDNDEIQIGNKVLKFKQKDIKKKRKRRKSREEQNEQAE